MNKKSKLTQATFEQSVNKWLDKCLKKHPAEEVEKAVYVVMGRNLTADERNSMAFGLHSILDNYDHGIDSNQNWVDCFYMARKIIEERLKLKVISRESEN